MNFELSNNFESSPVAIAILLNSNDESFKINLNNKCLNSLNYLNQELVNLGFNSIYLNHEELNLTSTNILSIDFNSLIVTIVEFLKRYRSQLPLLEKLQEQCHRLDKDNELHLKKRMQLKDLNESQSKEIKSSEEKCRQFQIKLNKLNKTIKDDHEEIRKLKSLIEQRDAFYKHDRKKIDIEMQKLKEKLQQFITNKSNLYANIDMNDTLQRNSAKQRATWNSDSSKKQMDVYTHLIRDYESRLKSVIMENGDLKQTVTNIAIKLNQLCKNFKKIKKNEIDEYIENDNTEFILNLPFESLNSKLDEYYKMKFSLIEEHFGKSENDTQTQLNTTFTIDDDDDDDDDENGFYDSINEESNNSLNNNKSLIKSDLSTQSEMEYLKNELNEYKRVINTQNEMISSFNQNLTINSDKSISFIEIEANSIIEERTRLAEEKKFYYKQKLQFEEEKLRYNQAILQLAKQRKSFEEEKEGFYKTKLYESFSKSFDVDDNSYRETSSRLSLTNTNSSIKSLNMSKAKVEKK